MPGKVCLSWPFKVEGVNFIQPFAYKKGWSEPAQYRVSFVPPEKLSNPSAT